MKNKLIVALGLAGICLIAFALMNTRAPKKAGRTGGVIASIANTFKYKQTEVPQTRAADASRPATRVDAEITALTTQLLDVDHELQNMGFPKVFLDQRLRDDERKILLSKVELSSQLQTRLNQLKIQKIDLEAREDL
jgi:hypothetical protein